MLNLLKKKKFKKKLKKEFLKRVKPNCCMLICNYVQSEQVIDCKILQFFCNLPETIRFCNKLLFIFLFSYQHQPLVKSFFPLNKFDFKSAFSALFISTPLVFVLLTCLHRADISLTCNQMFALLLSPGFHSVPIGLFIFLLLQDLRFAGGHMAIMILSSLGVFPPTHTHTWGFSFFYKKRKSHRRYLNRFSSVT